MLLAPVMTNPTPAPSEWIEMVKGISHLLRYTAEFNFTGQPAITLNGGFDKRGAPIGFQLVGKHLSETCCSGPVTPINRSPTGIRGTRRWISHRDETGTDEHSVRRHPPICGPANRRPFGGDNGEHMFSVQFGSLTYHFGQIMW